MKAADQPCPRFPKVKHLWVDAPDKRPVPSRRCLYCECFLVPHPGGGYHIEITQAVPREAVTT